MRTVSALDSRSVEPFPKSKAPNEAYNRNTDDGEGENVAVEVVGEWDWTNTWAAVIAHAPPDVEGECIQKEEDAYQDAYG